MKKLSLFAALVSLFFLSSSLHAQPHPSAQSISDSWIANGMGYDSSNRFDSSIVCYSHALAADSSSVEALWRLANAYFRSDSVRSSIDCCFRAIGLDPKNKDVYYLLGSVYFSQHSYKSAEEYLRRATEFGGPSFVNAWCRLAESYLLLNDTAQAEACLRSVIDNDPSFQRAYFLLGEVCRNRGDNAAALEWYGSAIRKFPLYPEALYSMALCYSNIANLKGAIDCLNKVVKLQPDNSEALFLLGRSLYLNGDSEKAAVHLRHALDLNPHLEPAKALLSAIQGY